jgi:hypothetical protein
MLPAVIFCFKSVEVILLSFKASSHDGLYDCHIFGFKFYYERPAVLTEVPRDFLLSMRHVTC